MTTLPTAVQLYLRRCDAKGIDPKTVRWYHQKLRDFIRLLPAETTSEELRAPQLIEAMAVLRAQRPNGKLRSSHTLHGYTQVVRGWLAWLGKQELAPGGLDQKLELPRVAKRIIPVVTLEDQAALLEAARFEQQPWLVERDRAIVRLMLDTGLRAGEVCRLRRRDLHLELDPHVRVIGKGDKEREVGPLAEETLKALRRYLRLQPRPAPDDVVFLNRYHQPLTPSGLDRMLYRLRDWAGMRGQEIRAHVLRHTYAVETLAAGCDIKILSLLLGHSSVTTTEIYLRSFTQQSARHLVPRRPDSVKRPLV